MARLSTKGLYFEYLLVIYNVIQTIVAIRFASANGILLVAFGLNSLTDIISGLAFISAYKNIKLPFKINHKIENQKISIVLLFYISLGIYILIKSFELLILHNKYIPSISSIIIALVAIAILPVLAFNQYYLGKQLQDKILLRQSRKTLISSWIPLALLLSILSNYWFAFWQAGALFGLIIVFNLVKKGLKTWSLTEPVDNWQESDEEEAQV